MSRRILRVSIELEYAKLQPTLPSLLTINPVRIPEYPQNFRVEVSMSQDDLKPRQSWEYLAERVKNEQDSEN